MIKSNKNGQSKSVKLHLHSVATLLGTPKTLTNEDEYNSPAMNPTSSVWEVFMLFILPSLI